MSLFDFIKKMNDREESEPLDPNVRDDRLTSLQRMRQKQINELMKKRLQREIVEYNKQKFHRDMGFSDPNKKIDISKQDFNILHDKPLMKLRKGRGKRKSI